MNLTSRGIAYNVSSPAISAAETGETVIFMGHQSRAKQVQWLQRQQPASDLMFLGRRYSR